MPKSLADLKAKPKSLPTRPFLIYLDQEALADVARLRAEREDVILGAVRSNLADEGERKGPPRRTGEAATPPRVAEIDAEIEVLYDRMRETEGELLIRAIGFGEWQQFKDENPPREGSKTDEEMAYGLMNSTVLLASLSRFVVSWNGEAFAPGDWDGWFAAQVAPADMTELCRAVMMLHEARIQVPKARSIDSSDTPQSATD